MAEIFLHSCHFWVVNLCLDPKGWCWHLREEVSFSELKRGNMTTSQKWWTETTIMDNTLCIQCLNFPFHILEEIQIHFTSGHRMEIAWITLANNIWWTQNGSNMMVLLDIRGFLYCEDLLWGLVCWAMDYSGSPAFPMGGWQETRDWPVGPHLYLLSGSTLDPSTSTWLWLSGLSKFGTVHL